MSIDRTKFNMNLENWHWLNEPASWGLADNQLNVITDVHTDFWQKTWYGFQRHSGHVFGCFMENDFTFQVCVEGRYTDLYDQAGIMLQVDEKIWLKGGIEFTDGSYSIGSVFTNEFSDWAAGFFSGSAEKFWLRVTLKENSIRLQYSIDQVNWPLLRLCHISPQPRYFIGVMCCTPERSGLAVRFSDFRLTPPLAKDLHDLS